MAWSCGTSANHVTISSQTGSEPEPYEFNPLKQGVSGPERSNSAVFWQVESDPGSPHVAPWAALQEAGPNHPPEL